MSIMHHAPVDAASDEAFVFAEGGITCSICAPASWGVGKVIAFAEEKLPGEGERWVSVDKAKLFGVNGSTPKPCNHATGRRHWFMIRGVIG